MASSVIHQDLYTAKCPPLYLNCVQLGGIFPKSIKQFLATATLKALGVATSYNTDCGLDGLAFASGTHVLLVVMGNKPLMMTVGKKILSDMIFCNTSYKKHGFNMDKIAAALHLDLDVPILEAFDIRHSRHPRGSPAAILATISGDSENTLDRNNVLKLFLDERSANSSIQRLALRAWASYRAATEFRSCLKETPAIDTKTADRLNVTFLAKAVRDADRLDCLKPTSVRNDVSGKFSNKSGFVELECTRFKTRLRTSRMGNQKIEFETQTGKVSGRAVKVDGRSAKISVAQKIGEIKSVVTVGKEDPTSAENQRTEIVLAALQGSEHLFNSAFLQKMFFPNYPAKDFVWPSPFTSPAPKVHFPHRPLNKSQRQAVEHCLSRSDKRRNVLIRGPPGTGKTTVIAACVTSIIEGTSEATVWIVAQSNVAVKNVAEKLADSNFLDFKLLVSKDFHFDWHEHLYEQIQRNVIQSSDFEKSIVGNERLLGGSRVILCTMSMLSNGAMRDGGFTRIVPIQTLIVDEASQIEVGDYLPILSQYQSTLQKMVFIGDDKQLAPYGQEDLKDLRSVFEIPHLRAEALFLDTQYRMPTTIGDFISKNVYKGKLKTEHKIAHSLCCKFVDVKGGQEAKPNGGNSWGNTAEVNAVVHIARKYTKEGKTYRVITPYDGQRNMIEAALKGASLPWENCCFNVDAFQGNEEDHIIVSVVRSNGPGFLKNERRMNVMLSRCKQSMIICSSKSFLSKGAIKSTLVGKMSEQWADKSANAWISMNQILNATW